MSISINASVYLMWNCDLPGSTDVPFGEVDWNASATLSAGAATGTQPNVTAVHQSWSTEPQWSTVFSAGG